MVKYFFLLFFLYSAFALADGQLFTDWLKTGPTKQPRYFLKNSKLSLCGILDAVTALKIENPNEKIQIESCLMASDSLDGEPPTAYEIMDMKGEKFLIRKYINKEDKIKPANPIYEIPAKAVATLWAVRYPEGEIMFYGPNLCEKVHDWRIDRNFDLKTELPSNPIMPFPIKSKGEAVRYHAFEYNMGCGT